MITNIERVFLADDDLEFIHPYFAEHRGTNSFLAHLKIQRNYTVALVLGALTFFTLRDVTPFLDVQSEIDWLNVAPYVAAIWFFWQISSVSHQYENKYKDFLRISPGLTVDRKIDFGTTHGGRAKR